MSSSSSLAALLTPKRSLPVLAVTITMACVEAYSTRDVRSVITDLVIFFAFWLIAPLTWRLLCSGDALRRRGGLFMGYMLYLGQNMIILLLLGRILPLWLGLRSSYMLGGESIIVIFVLFSVGGWGLGRDIELEEGLATQTKRAEALKREAERAQLLAIRTHLDPHFLFNTLNAIAEWCHEAPETAERATLELATMLRTILEGVREELWSLDRELELLRNLFDLYEIRDPERYRFTLVVDEALERTPPRLPPMILLPLVENAIKHGPSAGNDGPLTLELKLEGDRLEVRLRNPGRFQGRRLGGEGILMVERRLALTYGDQVTLRISSEGEETHTRLSLPRSPALQKGSS